MHQLAEVGLATDEAEGDALSSAEGWQVHDELNGVDIVSDHNELRLSFFNQGGNMVKTELEVDGLLGLVLSAGLSFLLESVLLGGLGLG